MAERKKEVRRLEIHRWLSKRRRFTEREMARRLGVSMKTVSRDLHEMQADGLPVEYDPIEETWWYTREVVEFPPLLMAEEDRRALLFSLHAAEQLEGTPVVGQVRRAYQKLLETLGPERTGHLRRWREQTQA